MSIKNALRWVFGVAWMALVLAVGAIFAVALKVDSVHEQTGNVARDLELHRTLMTDMSHYMVEAHELFSLEEGVEALGEAKALVELDFKSISELHATPFEDDRAWDAEEIARLAKLKTVFAE